MNIACIIVGYYFNNILLDSVLLLSKCLTFHNKMQSYLLMKVLMLYLVHPLQFKGFDLPNP